MGQYTYIQDTAGRLSTRLADGAFDVEFQSSDRFTIGVLDDYELLLRPFTVAGLRVPTGGYRFTTSRVGYTLGQQRPVSGAVLFERGDFYGGTRSALTINRSRVNVTSAVLGGTEPDAQLARSAGRPRDLDAGRLAPHLHDDAADVRQRARAVQLGRRASSASTPACAGNTGSAASCSSSTTTNAIAAPRSAGRSCRTARSS